MGEVSNNTHFERTSFQKKVSKIKTRMKASPYWIPLMHRCIYIVDSKITALNMSTVVLQEPPGPQDTDDIAAGGGPGINWTPVVKAALYAHRLSSKSHGPIKSNTLFQPQQRPPFVQRHRRPVHASASLRVGRRSPNDRGHESAGNVSERSRPYDP